ncbi:MAG: hypothetical protein JST50_19100 [Bacteroidetes bacterium]|jgi:hypothetical protein|nr:hypothetical protein [Bacteroidota bacterium]
MSRLPFLIIIFSVLFSISCHIGSNKSEAINAKWKKIPDSWIKRATQPAYQKPDTVLLHEFAKIVKLDTGGESPSDSGKYAVFNSLHVDLDGDGKDEFLCLQGWNVDSPYLCVFKQFNDGWYLIYIEQIETFFKSPALYVANNYSKNKTFYVRQSYEHDADIAMDGYRFYKLIDNNVYKCLDILDGAYASSGRHIAQAVKSSFEFKGDSDDLAVFYSYNFFPSYVFESDYYSSIHGVSSLIEGQGIVDYVYNSKEHKYKLNIPPKSDKTVNDLTADKISCFANFASDSLFVKAYQGQIDDVIKTGTPQQKKLLREYLSLVNKDKAIYEPKTYFPGRIQVIIRQMKEHFME